MCDVHRRGRLVTVGVLDGGACGEGSVQELRKRNGLDKEHIVEVVRKVLDGRV